MTTPREWGDLRAPVPVRTTPIPEPGFRPVYRLPSPPRPGVPRCEVCGVLTDTYTGRRFGLCYRCKRETTALLVAATKDHLHVHLMSMTGDRLHRMAYRPDGVSLRWYFGEYAERWRASTLRSFYTKVLTAELLRRQGGDCAGAGPHKGAFVLDHDHNTGAIRAALCTACNNRAGP